MAENFPIIVFCQRIWLWSVVCLLLSCCVGINVTGSDTEDEGSHETFKIEGKVSPPDYAPDNWQIYTKILINCGEYLGFLRKDGSFVIYNIPTGSYVVEVANPDFIYEPARVDITSKGKIRARKLNFIQTSSVFQLQYPLRFKIKAPFKYFQVREQWRVTDFLLSPMVLMMVLPLLLIMVLPKLMNAADPETQREMQQSLQMPKYDMPELSEMVTSFFAGGKKPPAKTKTNKKRQ